MSKTIPAPGARTTSINPYFLRMQTEVQMLRERIISGDFELAAAVTNETHGKMIIASFAGRSVRTDYNRGEVRVGCGNDERDAATPKNVDGDIIA